MLLSMLQARIEGMRQRLLTLLCMRRAGVALELLQHRILFDAGADDEAGGSTKLLAGQVDRLDWLGALELVDWQCVAIDTAH